MVVVSEVHPAQGAAAAFQRLTAALDRAVCWVCIALFAAIFLVMVLQVTSRYLLGSPLIWSEELARYLYIWACYLGAPVAMRRGTHIAITQFIDRFPLRAVRAIGVCLHIVALLFLAELAIQGAIVTVRSHTLEAITIPVPWSLIYLAAPVSAVLMMLQTVEAIWIPRTGPAKEVLL
jgi:TRAP-type C4-dicarboxylate transport system permease small subunit